MKTKTTKDRILDSALRLFSKKGYLGSTTREIAEDAGVAEVTLFRYFSSKEKLFEEMIKSNSFLPALKGLLPKIKDMSYTEALSEIARKFLDRLTERQELIRIMNAEFFLYPAKVGEIYHNFIDEIFRTLASYFREMQGKGMLNGFNPELGARAFLGMFFSYFNAQKFLTYKGYSHSDDSVVIKEFVSIFINGTLKNKG